VHTWAVANQKGGVGKTTTAVSLAGWLAARGHATLLVDLDPHGSLTSYFGFNPEEIAPSVYDLFRQRAAGQPPDVLPCLRPTPVPHLTLLPAATSLATLDRQLGAREGMGLVLAQSLQAVNGRFEYVLLDCAPLLGVLLVNALACAQRLVIPVQTEHLALNGLERMMRTLAMVARSRRQPLSHLIVPTMFDRRTRAALECLEELRRRYGADLWPDTVPEDTRLREAARAGAPIAQHAPQSRAAQAYSALLDTLLAAVAPVARQEAVA
jgi:chromosome partitioning protein